jgi:hypothetical protein
MRPAAVYRGPDQARPAGTVSEKQIRDYLRPLLPTRDDIDSWLDGSAFPFCKYDHELGYLHIDRDWR